MRSLSTISYRSLLVRKARYALTALGVTFGVAVLFAVLVTAGVTRRALDDTVRGGMGRADVAVGPVGAFDSVLPPGTDARVAALPGVQQVVGSINLRSLLQPAPPPGQPFSFGSETRNHIVVLSGVDLPSYSKVHDFTLDRGRMFAPGSREVVLPKSLADRLGIHLGQAVVMASPGGIQQLTAVGFLADTGAALSANGSIVYTSLPTARALYGKGDVLGGLDVVLTDHSHPGRWIAEQRRTLGDSVAMRPASELNAGFRGFVAGVNSALSLISLIALFVGAFLIFLTFSLSVAERTRIYGTLRALGAVPRQVRRVVVTEAAALGLVSAVAGIVLGYVLAIAGVGLIGSLLYLRLPPVGFPVVPALISIALGVAVSALAAWIPARRAAALSPVAAMRDGMAASEGRSLIGLRVAVLAVGLVIGTLNTPTALRSLGVLFVLLGAVMLVPFLLRPLARVLGIVTGRIARGAGDIAVMHLVKERSRSAYTLALIMVVLAMILAVGASNLAMTNTLDRVLTRQQGSDLQVVSPGSFDPAVGTQLAKVAGVEGTSPIRFGQTDVVDGTSNRGTSLTVVDPASYFRIAGFAWVDGDDASAAKALAGGHAVLLPDAFAGSLGRKRGQQVTLRTAQGLQPFTVAGTYAQIGGGFGVIAGAVDSPLFGSGRPNLFLASVKPGANPDAVRVAIINTIHQPMFVDTSTTVKAQAHAQLQGFFSLAYAMLLLAAVTGMLGMANTLVFSVLLRTREVGMLRSIGAVRRQVRGMVLVEAATMAIVAFLLAVPLGAVLASGLIAGQRRTLGVTSHFTFPWGLVVPIGIMALVIALVASVLPARRAGKLEVVSALRFE